MKRLLLSLVVTMLACTGVALDPTEAGMPLDGGRPCGLAGEIELRGASEGTCSAAPIVVLTIADDGTVARASAHVPVGVTVPASPCTSHAPTASCTWMLDVVCDGPNGAHLAVTGAIMGSGSSWTGDSVTVEMTGNPPARLMCAATGAVATP